jgi:hypothetical protein
MRVSAGRFLAAVVLRDVPQHNTTRRFTGLHALFASFSAFLARQFHHLGFLRSTQVLIIERERYGELKRGVGSSFFFF